MAIVWSNWYIVMAVLAIGVIACIVVFVLMDKKDKLIISDFVKKNKESTSTAPAESAKPAQVESVEEVKAEPVVESKAEVAEEKVESQSEPENKE